MWSRQGRSNAERCRVKEAVDDRPRVPVRSRPHPLPASRPRRSPHPTLGLGWAASLSRGRTGGGGTVVGGKPRKVAIRSVATFSGSVSRDPPPLIVPIPEFRRLVDRRGIHRKCRGRRSPWTTHGCQLGRQSGRTHGNPRLPAWPQWEDPRKPTVGPVRGGGPRRVPA